MFAHSNRSTIWEDNLYLHATHHAPSNVFPGVDWIKFIYKLIWERGERRSTFGLNGHGTEVELRAQGSRPRIQKNIRGQRQPFRGQTFSRETTQAQVFSKKIIIRSSKFFFQVFSKKQNQKISKTTSFSTKNDLQNFKDSKNTAVLEPRTMSIFEDLKLWGQGLQNWSWRTSIHCDQIFPPSHSPLRGIQKRKNRTFETSL